MKKTFIVLLTAGFVLWQLSQCRNSDNGFPDKNAAEGYQLATKYCASCHQFPEPSLLNKKTWQAYVLPKMAPYMGYSLFAGAYMENDDNPRVLSRQQWNNIQHYYISLAPEHPLARDTDTGPIKDHTPLFTEIAVPGNVPHPVTTLVQADPAAKHVLFGDGVTGQIYELSDKLAVVDSVQAGTGVVNVRVKDGAFWMLSMGLLYPSDKKEGRLALGHAKDSAVKVLLGDLQRPVHATYADLTGDGNEDIVVCEFGDRTGALGWFENKGNGSYSKHVLRAYPGAIRSVVSDFNRDGRPDIMALMAQGDESMFIYYNEGAGNFREERILRFPPSYGSNYFELGDFNGDGFPDIITTNGDNGDYLPILKNYHGIRIFLNDGRNHFEQKLFLPVNGAGKVVARDFDGDGDLDLASIAYFADFKARPREAFIYWENKGNLKFIPSSINHVTAGRWIVMDAADIDGDGDPDIVLGNANFRLGGAPEELRNRWDTSSLSILILKNNLR